MPDSHNSTGQSATMDVEMIFAFFTVRNLLKYTAAILVIALTRFCYGYWKYRRSYGSLPTYSMELRYLTLWLLGKFPKDIPSASYFFREIVSILTGFQKEGICLLWGFQPFLVVLDDEYTKIFSTERSTADKAPFVYSILQEMIGKGLVTTNGANWKDQRKRLNPAFRFDLLKGNINLINDGARIMVNRLSGICNKPTVEVVDILKLGSLKILCGSMLGLDVNNEQHDSKMRRYLELLNILAAYTMFRVPRPWLYWRTTNMLFPSGWRHRKLYKEFHEFTNSLVKQMMDSYSSSSSDDTGEDSATSSGGKQFVRLLLENHKKDPSFTLQNVQDEVTSIIFGGHDTTAYTLLWCFYLLGVYPEIQKKAFEEAESVMGNSRECSYSDMCKLSYIECVIKETLRIYPTVPMFGRMIDKDVEFGKYKVWKGTIIGFAPYLLHRNPKYFPDPEKFDPERFSGNDVKPWTYIPFSEGMRSCIGKKYGMVVMKIVLAHILRNFEITSLDRREDIEFDWNILLTPLKPLRFHLTPRQPDILPQG